LNTAPTRFFVIAEGGTNQKEKRASRFWWNF